MSPRIAVLLPVVWSVRNVVYSGVLANLTKSGGEVHLLLRDSPPLDEPAFSQFLDAASCRSLLVPPARHVRGKAFVDNVIESAFNHQHHNRTYPVFRRWHRRHESILRRLRSGLINSLGVMAQSPPVLERVTRYAETLYRRARDLEPIRQQLRDLAPDILWSTFNVSELEHSYYLAARDLQIPVVCSILSFDNLTSRGLLPTYDHYLAWNERMRDQLLRFYPRVAPVQVTVTGTPQFDFHRYSAFLWSRQQTLANLGLPQNARYFVYAAGFDAFAPAEAELVHRLVRRLAADETLRDYYLIVRLHPQDEGRRWREFQCGGRVRLSPAFAAPTNGAAWTLSVPEDQARLVSCLRHAEACINVASTMSLDAAILDTPALCLEFSTEPDSPREVFYDGYRTEHYGPLVESGGIRLAHNWPELFSLMRGAIANPQRDRKLRARMVRYECGLVDGHAAERVSAALMGVVNRLKLRAA